MVLINSQVIEEILSYFGRTGSNQRPRIRKFHAELFLTKFMRKEKVISPDEISRPKEYLQRMVKYSKGFLEFINEEVGEIVMSDAFFNQIEGWLKQYQELEELDESDEKLNEQGIIVKDEGITFDGKLTYSRFHKVVSDEGENMNNPEEWLYNDIGIESYNQIDFSKKNTPIFSSRLFILKFYVLRKIDEVAFVTSRFVHCPNCGANYVVPSAKIDFQQSYKCEKYVGDKQCKTTLKKFPARKMLPTYIYEIGVEIKNKDSTEFKEFFLESFVELLPGFFSGMCFGRTEQKTNSFYFTCLTAKEEKSKHVFFIKDHGHKHNFFNLVDSVTDHIQRVGFVIDREKARLPVIIETIKKLNLTFNKEINLDHSLYFGAPGIGKTYALTLLHHLFYSNSGSISGPRFTLAGLTGGQKEIYYQDVAKKKNVPGLFSNQAFVFDEINNAQFLSDDKATNLFKSVALASSGTSSTVGGKEFPRIALIAGTGNYDLNHLRHYENKINKIYSNEMRNKNKAGPTEQSIFLEQSDPKDVEIPMGFDYYSPFKNYGVDVPKELKTAVLKVRDEANNFLTGFSKPLMERFYFGVLVHPKYDKAYLKQKQINVKEFLISRKSQYSNRELISQLFVPNLNEIIIKGAGETIKKFNDHEVEDKWSNQARTFLGLMASKYVEFFSMFNRISQVHVFILFSLSLINKETELSFETRRIFERIISLLHTPIEMKDFHLPDFENYNYLGETKASAMEIVKRHSDEDLRDIVDFESPKVKAIFAELETNRRIKKVGDYRYELDKTKLYSEETN